jgi:hypothetical protein
VCHETVRQEKHAEAAPATLRVHSPKHNAVFVAAMEGVLDVYCRPHDSARPVVCMDETCKQRVGSPACNSGGARAVGTLRLG